MCSTLTVATFLEKENLDNSGNFFNDRGKLETENSGNRRGIFIIREIECFPFSWQLLMRLFCPVENYTCKFVSKSLVCNANVYQCLKNLSVKVWKFVWKSGDFFLSGKWQHCGACTIVITGEIPCYCECNISWRNVFRDTRRNVDFVELFFVVSVKSQAILPKFFIML